MFNSANVPSLADIAAVTGNNKNDGMWGGDGWWAIIIFAIIFGWNGFGNNGWGGNGGSAPKGSGTYRRGYDEPPYYHMTPEKYHEMEDMRDMDRNKHGRMYYTEPSGNMHMNESNYDRTKRNYTETKELHKSNTPEDKEHNMKSLETYMAELARDVSGMVNDMSPEEKALTKTKLTALVNKIQ